MPAERAETGGEHLDLLTGGEMRSRISSSDWSATPLGPASEWPQSLRSAVEIMLTSRFPMLVWWGRELIQFYNDACLPVLGERHPSGLGQPASICWAEAWPLMGPLADAVMNQGVSTWSERLEMVMTRNGFAEEVYMTFSCSPIRDESGATAGLFCACTEETPRVLGERRLAALGALNEATAAPQTAGQACAAIAGVLAGIPRDLPFTLLYLLDEPQRRARLAARTGLGEGSPLGPAQIDLRAAEPWPFSEVLAQGGMVIVRELPAGAAGGLPGPWPEPARGAVMLPLAPPGRAGLAGFLVAGLSPRLVFDGSYRTFLGLLARQVATALSAAHADEEESRRAAAPADAFVQKARRRLADEERPPVVPQPPAERRPRVLSVGDNADMRDYVRRILERRYEVVTADDGEAALEAVQSHRPDLVLADVILPRMDGIALLKAIRRGGPELLDIPVVLLSTRAGEEAKLEGLEAGADDYLVKPFAAQELLARLEASLAVARLRRRVAEAVRESEALRQSEERLRESEERFRQFAASSSDALWIRDADSFDFLFVNPAVETIYGIGIPELLRDQRLLGAIVVPEDRDAVARNVVRVSQGEVVTQEYRIQRRSDLAFRWIRSTGFPLRNSEARPHRIGAIVQDITDAKLAAAHQGVLLAELQHRVRNIMAMIRSVTTRTADSASDVEEYARLMTGRLLALSRTQTLLTRTLNVGVDVGVLVREELEAQAQHAGQYTLEGPTVLVSPKAAEVLCLAVHELATNALKYGALSPKGGSISVEWKVIPSGERQLLRLDWSEARPAEPGWTPPLRQGFGRQLIERRVPYELGGRGDIEIRRDGVQARIEFPLKGGDSILETDAPARSRVFGGSIDMTAEPSLEGRTVLVLEDDFYLAEDTAGALLGAGAKVVGPFPNEAAAMDAIGQERPSAAVVDINLGSGPSFRTARALQAAGTPFLFVTGYEARDIPAEFEGVVRLQKPVELREVVRAIAALTG
ncbi:response regulator [Roseococcus sp. YIM B11640]|uniref:response regulator n=1 Tax=Roseococcus sp. YIM B11640 TaxID=3133973 RepID=UPI003C7DE9CB